MATEAHREAKRRHVRVRKLILAYKEGYDPEDIGAELSISGEQVVREIHEWCEARRRKGGGMHIVSMNKMPGCGQVYVFLQDMKDRYKPARSPNPPIDGTERALKAAHEWFGYGLEAPATPAPADDRPALPPKNTEGEELRLELLVAVYDLTARIERFLESEKATTK